MIGWLRSPKSFGVADRQARWGRHAILSPSPRWSERCWRLRAGAPSSLKLAWIGCATATHGIGSLPTPQLSTANRQISGRRPRNERASRLTCALSLSNHTLRQAQGACDLSHVGRDAAPAIPGAEQPDPHSRWVYQACSTLGVVRCRRRPRPVLGGPEPRPAAHNNIHITQTNSQHAQKLGVLLERGWIHRASDLSRGQMGPFVDGNSPTCAGHPRLSIAN
jgi:hypothetical protein